MGQLEKYGLYVLCLVIFLILGVTLWGGGDTAPPSRKQEAQTPMRAPNPVTPPPSTPSPTAAVEPKSIDIFGAGLLQPEPKQDEPKRNAPVAETPKAGEQPNAPKVASGDSASAPVGDSTATTYKVQTGDTFESIARNKLGDAKRQTEIAKLNPKVQPNRMRVGQELVLPGAKPAGKATEPVMAANAKKSATPKEATAKTSDAKSAEAKESTKDAGADRSYVVGKGDTFGRIAQTQLGSSKRVDEIRELNPSVDPTRLRVGQRIKLPKK